MENARKKNILFGVLLIILLFPFINMNSRFIKSGDLDGANPAPNAHFSWEKWWDGSFQKGKDLYLNDNIGFRQDLVRIANQIDFTLFEKINAGGVVMDEDEYLYYSDYLDEYSGASFIGEEQPRNTLTKLKKIQDTLEHLGKTVVLVYAPSKPYYYPEHLPGKTYYKEGKQTNFKSYFRIGDSLGVNQLDMNRWYVSLKNKTPYPLFSKQGIHYTIYGALFAADSINKYIEQRRGIKMLHPSFDKIISTPKASKTDDDVGRMLNLIFPIQEQFYYPENGYLSNTPVAKPKVIYIGDSFVWPLLFGGMMDANTEPEFWYYSNHIHNANYEQGEIASDLDKYDWLKSIKEADCIVMVYTATNMIKMQEGFLNKAYEHFYGLSK